MERQRLKVDITEGIIWKQLLLFAMPLLVSNILQQLYNTVDSAIVGKFINDDALAAVGSTGSLTGMLVGLFMGIATGAGVIIAQHYGARNIEKLQDAVHTAMALSVISSVILMVIGVWATPALLRIMGSPENVIDMSIEYLRVYFIGILPGMVYNIGSGVLRAVGDSKRPLYYLLIGCIINICLDLVFINVFHWGVAGAAWATNIAQVVSAVLVMMNLMKSTDVYKVHLKKIRIHMPMLGNIVRIGIPAGCQAVVISLSNVIIQSKINSFGSNAMAAASAMSKIDGFLYMLINAFGLAITTFVGQNIGAGKYDRVRQSVKTCMVMVIGSAAVLSCILTLNGRLLFTIFTNSEDVMVYAFKMMYLILPLYPLLSFAEVLSGATRGMGRSIVPMIISLAGMCIIRIIWIAVVPNLWQDISAVYLCYPVTWSLTGTAYVIYYLKISKNLEKT
jgi:putative efflux protein, MATE family